MSHAVSDGLDSTIVALDTDDGVTGWGEMATITPRYADAFASGARAGVGRPRAARGGPGRGAAARAARPARRRDARPAYVKSAIDMACWDAAARSAGRPLYAALGARFGERVALYNVVTIGDVEHAVTCTRRLLARGYRRLQVKVGREPHLDAGACTPCASAPGRRRAVRRRQRRLLDRDRAALPGRDGGPRLHLEQPCATYEECRQVRRVVPPTAGARRVDRVARRPAARPSRRRAGRHHGQGVARRRPHAERC